MQERDTSSKSRNICTQEADTNGGTKEHGFRVYGSADYSGTQGKQRCWKQADDRNSQGNTQAMTKVQRTEAPGISRRTLKWNTEQTLFERTQKSQ